MPPIVLLAELLANGFDIEIRDNVLTYIGDYNALPLTLLADMDAGQRELSYFIIGVPMEGEARDE
jgi:hypothetical protein